MTEVERQIDALLELADKTDRKVLIGLLINVIAGALKRAGGRPRGGDPRTMTHAEFDVWKTTSETSDSTDLSSGSGSDLALFPDPDASKPDPGDRELDGRPPEPEPPGFLEFWGLYPKKVGKGDARRCWRKHKPPITKVRAALAWQVLSDQWRQGFIPNPSTYINQGRWDDEPPRRLGPVLTEKEQRSVSATQAWLARNGGAK